MSDNRNFTMMTDLYQLTMMNGYFKNNKNEKVIFDLFYRTNPCGNGYAICVGLEDVVNYIKNLHFEKDDIEYLRSLNLFEEDFLEYLSNFKFTGDIWGIPEGTIVFPMEPLIKVKANIMEAQLVETTLLNFINHQSLIATKAARVCEAAGNKTVMEFGLRRAQGPDAGTKGARAAVIGGCKGTSNVLCGKLYELPIMGTHAHSWIMSFDTEFDAFMAYANTFKDNVILLVDTYNVVKSGVPNAIKVFQTLKNEGRLPEHFGIRIDSGDLAYLSKKARKMMDEAGFTKATICVSSDLDENVITSLNSQGACIDSYGVGTNLITSKDCPAFGGVYKLSGVEKDGKIIPKIKLSENFIKITNPGDKKIVRIYNKDGKANADIICMADETFDTSKDLIIFDPIDTWKKTRFKAGEYTVRELLVKVFENGNCVYELPKLCEIKEYAENEKSTMWEETRRLVNPHKYYVDLSDKLWNIKKELMDKYSD